MEYDSISISILKKISFLLIAYIVGYQQYSIAWLIIPLLVAILKEKPLNTEWLRRRDFVRRINRDGEKEVIGSLPNLPAWVQFPDMERVEWINKIIIHLWPNVNHYVHNIIKKLLQEKLNKKMEKYKISGLEFDKLIVGTVPFRIGGINVIRNVARNEIILDIDIMYAGDCAISFKYGRFKGGIKNFELFGRLRVIIKPLINTLPFAGGVEIFFLKPPEIAFDFDGLAGVLELRGLNGLLKKIVLNTICSLIVLPNKYPLIFSKTEPLNKSRFKHTSLRADFSKSYNSEEEDSDFEETGESGDVCQDIRKYYNDIYQAARPIENSTRSVLRAKKYPSITIRSGLNTSTPVNPLASRNLNTASYYGTLERRRRF